MAASNTVVQTNVLALNSHRNLNTVGAKQAKASQRLSSGYRINSAADDAAGLAISEKMRSQIRGLDQASTNAQDGISLVQTAEGGMQEINNMVQRIRELIVQASNDTNENNTIGTGDRQKIQDEIDQLVEEIDEMAERVEFNAKTIINGDFDYTDIAYTTFKDAKKDLAEAQFNNQLAEKAFNKAEANMLAAESIIDQWNTKLSAHSLATITADMQALGYASLSAADQALFTANLFAAAGEIFDLDADITAYFAQLDYITSGSMDIAATEFGDVLTSITAAITELETIIGTGTADADIVARDMIRYLNAMRNDFNEMNANLEAYLGSTGDGTADGYVFTYDEADEAYNDPTTGTRATLIAMQSAFDTAEAAFNLTTSADRTGGLYFQVGANSNQSITVGIGSIKTDDLGIGDGNGNTILDVIEDSGRDITDYLDLLDVALTYVTTERAKLGAVQNRLEYTMASLDISSENLSAAESRIRDTDMAKEMMNLSKANVLQQAAVSMLAQANSAPNSILQLLG